MDTLLIMYQGIVLSSVEIRLFCLLIVSPAYAQVAAVKINSPLLL
jgi:hypothetical protein